MFYTYKSGGCGPRGYYAMWSHRGGRHGWGRGFGGSWGGDGGEGSGRRGRMFDSGELRLLLLMLIADEPRHGYDLIREIEARTNGAYAPSPGVVYPTLTLLADMGLIEERASEGAKKLFAVTPAGQAHLDENADTVATLVQRITEIGAKRAKSDSTSMRRAMGNLGMVLANKFAKGEIDDDTLHEIVALIDEAAGKIERL